MNQLRLQLRPNPRSGSPMGHPRSGPGFAGRLGRAVSGALCLAWLGAAGFSGCSEDSADGDGLPVAETTPTDSSGPSVAPTGSQAPQTMPTMPSLPGSGGDMPAATATAEPTSSQVAPGQTEPGGTTPPDMGTGATTPSTPSTEPPGMGGSGGAAGAPADDGDPNEPVGAGGQDAGVGGMPDVEGAAGMEGAGGGDGAEMVDGWDPCPDAEPCRILPLGDSITEGIGSSDSSAWRGPLFRLTLENDKDITFVGSRMAGPMMIDGTPFPRAHEGTSGITVSGLDMKLGGLVNQIGDAHIILVHIGTNDMYTQPGPAMAPQRLGTFLDNVMGYWPEALIVVAQITPYPNQNSDIMTYNDAIVPIVQARIDAGAKMMMVDQFTGFPNNELADVVHPNDAGYARMAGVWYEAIGQYLKP